jgi:hypothetical protein
LHKVPALPEGERIGPHTGIEEFDLKGAVYDGPGLADKLIKTIFLQASPSIRVHVEAMIRARRIPIDRDSKANRMALGSVGEHEVKIAGMKAVANAAGCIIERCEFASDRPNTCQAPVVERQGRFSPVEFRTVLATNSGDTKFMACE